MKMNNASIPAGRFIALTILIALFGGCTKNSNNVTGPTSTTPPGATVADSLRKVTLDALGAAYNALPRVDWNTDRQTLLQYIAGRPEFEESGIATEGNVWARFTDGRLVVLVQPTTSDSLLGSSSSVRGPSFGKLPLQPLDNLPASQTARIMNGVPEYGNCGFTAGVIGAWCQSAGYTVPPDVDATVDNLMKVQNVGIFYISTHGGASLGRDKTWYYALRTIERQSVALDGTYKVMLDGLSLVYMNTGNWYYAISAKFLTANMSFSSHSLVFLNACGSMELAYVFQGKVDLFVGWTQPTESADACNAAQFFFDRALGTNKFFPAESPPQRPFPTYDVYANLCKRNLNVSNGPTGKSELQCSPQPQVPGLALAPTISLTAYLPYPVSLFQIGGVFGDNTGSGGRVLFNGNNLPFHTWTNNSLVVDLPAGKGDLLVTVNGIKSNTIQMTQWNGTFDYTLRGAGTLKQHIVWNVSFWADVHSPRLVIATTPYFMAPRPICVMNSSTCTYDCSGDTVDQQGNVVESWSGSGSIPFSAVPGIPTTFWVYGQVDSVGSDDTQVQPFASGTYDCYTSDAGTYQDNLMSIDFGALSLRVAPGFVLKGDTQTQSDGIHTAVLKWGDMVPQKPPDPNGAR